MGWGSGSTLMEKIVKRIKNDVTDQEVRKIVYKILVEEFENQDWDTVDEVLYLDDALDDVIYEMHPGLGLDNT